MYKIKKSYNINNEKPITFFWLPWFSSFCFADDYHTDQDDDRLLTFYIKLSDELYVKFAQNTEKREVVPIRIDNACKLTYLVQPESR